MPDATDGNDVAGPRQQHDGWMAEWLCSGLQSRVRRFDSGFSLHLLDAAEDVIMAALTLRMPTQSSDRARVVELVDTRDLKSLGFTAVPVRVRLRAPN